MTRLSGQHIKQGCRSRKSVNSSSVRVILSSAVSAVPFSAQRQHGTNSTTIVSDEYDSSAIGSQRVASFPPIRTDLQLTVTLVGGQFECSYFCKHCKQPITS